MTSDRPVTQGARSPGSTRSTSSVWLVAALVVTAVCAGLLTAQLVGFLRFPFDDPAIAPAEVGAPEGALVVAVARTPGGPGEWANWARIIRELSHQLGRPLTVRYLSNEDEAAEVITEDRVDVAFVCPHHYVDLSEAGTCEGLVTPVISGSATTRFVILVRPDDPATCIEDLKGSHFAVSDKSSLGGFSYVAYLTKARGAKPEEYFSELTVGETQEQNMQDVLEGRVRATVASSVQVVAWDMSQFKVIEPSEPIGSPPVVVAADLAPELKDEIARILIDMDMPATLGEGSAIEGFETLDPASYEFAARLRGACGHHDEN